MQNDTSVLRAVLEQFPPQNQLVYLDTVRPQGSREYIAEKIRSGKITDRSDRESIVLTESEQDHLLAQLGQTAIWPENLFPKSKAIHANSLWTYVQAENRKRIKLLNQATLSKADEATIKKLRHNYQYVFTFTKPIYLRNNTVCLISYAAICGGDCGRTENSFYRKEGNEWVKWIVVEIGLF